MECKKGFFFPPSFSEFLHLFFLHVGPFQHVLRAQQEMKQTEREKRGGGGGGGVMGGGSESRGANAWNESVWGLISGVL